ncbi:AAA family ATPase [Streptomyces sp. NPDC004610]|uniref:AAA family ATPase n=1 Tax=unclassified Streptomyces TaxID=2593676 RepID=UPI0033BB6CE5
MTGPSAQGPGDGVVRRALSVGVTSFAAGTEFGDDDEGPDPLGFAAERVAAVTAALELPCFGYRCERLVSGARNEDDADDEDDGADETDEADGGPSAGRLGDLVHSRLSGGGPGEVLIVHVVSHGVLRPTGLYVLGADSVHSARTSIAGWLSEVEDYPGRPLVLFLLDLCHSGAAARLEWQLRRLLDGSHRAWVMAASAEHEAAIDGRFSEAVAEVLTALAEQRLQYDPGSRYVPFLWFADEVRNQLRKQVEARRGRPQNITVTALDGLGPELPFLPNPGYRAAGTAALPAAPPVGAAPPSLDEVADADHFRRHAQGGAAFPAGRADGAARPGLFTGRAAEVARLAEWLADGTAGARRLLVVTGSPGAGKSALLGVLLCAAHPELRAPTRALWEPLGREVPVMVVPLPVHARQRTLAEVVRSLVRRLGAHGPEWTGTAQGPETDPRRLIEALSRRTGPPPVLIADALDEARDPVELLRDLFHPLTTLDRPDGQPLCRVLLAARDEEPCVELIAGARTDGDLVDLDAVGTEALETDLRDYVLRLLGVGVGAEEGAGTETRPRPVGSTHSQATDGPQPHPAPPDAPEPQETPAPPAPPDASEPQEPPEEDLPAREFAAATAHALADPGRPAATGPHLIAALYTSYALQDAVRPALEESGAARELGERVPRDLPGLLELQFAGDHAHHLLRPVLTALAFAQGDGLPVGLVAAVTHAFGTPAAEDATPTTADENTRTAEVARLLGELRAFLRTVPDARGTALYRLLHQSIADELRGQAVPGPGAAPGATAGQAVYAALLDTLRDAADARRVLRWAGLDDYLRRHLAQHAVDADAFDALCADPGFLVHADPDRLDPELGHAVSESARSAATVYRTSAHVHRAVSDEGRRHILAIDAVRQGARTLADRLARPEPGQGNPMGWPPQWATASLISAAHAFTLPLPEDRVTVLATPETGVADVVTGTRGGRLRVWDALHGRVRGAADPGRGEIRALACTELAGQRVVIVVAADGVPQVRALPGLEPWQGGEALFGGAREVRALGCVEVVGRRMAVTAHADGRLMLWDLEGGLPAEELRSGVGRSTAVACLSGAGGPLVAVADDESTVRLCAPLGDDDGSDLQHPCRVTALALAVTDGRPCVVTGGEDGRVRVWDAVSRTLLAASAVAPGGPVYALAQVDAPGAAGPALRLLSGSGDGTIRIWDPAEGTEQGRLTRHMGAVTALARPPSQPPVLVSAGLDPALRVWHVPPDRPRGAPAPGHTSWVTALTRAALDGREVLVSAGADGLLHRWDLEEGTPYGPPVATAVTGAAGARPAALHALALVTVRRRPLVVTAGGDGRPRAWDLREGTAYGPAFDPAGAPVQALAATELDGRPVLVSGGTDGLLHLWDVDTGRRRGLPLAGHVGGVNALACATVDGRAAVLSCGDDGTLRLWDLSTGLPMMPPVVAHQGWATALSYAERDGVPVAVTGGQDGSVRLWELAGAGRGRQHGASLPVVGGVNALACGGDAEDPLIVAADDGAVRVWERAGTETVSGVGVPGAVQSLLVCGDRLVLGCEWEIVVLRRAS